MYTKEERGAKLAPKADVVVVDTQLGLKADKAAVCTKEESRAALARKSDTTAVDAELKPKVDKAAVYEGGVRHKVGPQA